MILITCLCMCMCVSINCRIIFLLLLSFFPSITFTHHHIAIMQSKSEVFHYPFSNVLYHDANYVEKIINKYCFSQVLFFRPDYSSFRSSWSTKRRTHHWFLFYFSWLDVCYSRCQQFTRYIKFNLVENGHANNGKLTDGWMTIHKND